MWVEPSKPRAKMHPEFGLNQSDLHSCIMHSDDVDIICIMHIIFQSLLHSTFTSRTKCFHSRKIVLLFLFCSPCQTKVILCQRLFLKREPLQYIMSDILKARKNFAQALSSICTTALVAEISLILNFSGKPTCHQG